MNGYAFHPEAEIDLDAIWEYIAEDNPDVPFPHQGHFRPDLHRVRCVS